MEQGPDPAAHRVLIPPGWVENMNTIQGDPEHEEEREERAEVFISSDHQFLFLRKDGVPDMTPRTARLFFLLDASGSMVRLCRDLHAPDQLFDFWFVVERNGRKGA